MSAKVERVLNMYVMVRPDDAQFQAMLDDEFARSIQDLTAEEMDAMWVALGEDPAEIHRWAEELHVKIMARSQDA